MTTTLPRKDPMPTSDPAPLDRLTLDQVAILGGVNTMTVKMWGFRGIERDGRTVKLRATKDRDYRAEEVWEFLRLLRAPQPPRPRRYPTAEPEGDLGRSRRNLGQTIRMFRMACGMHAKDLAEYMRAAGFPWTTKTVNDLEGGGAPGNTRNLYFIEAVALAKLLGADLDSLAAGVTQPPAPTPTPAPAPVAPGVIDRSHTVREDAMTWTPWMGQRGALEEYCAKLGIKPAEAMRQAVAELLERKRK